MDEVDDILEELSAIQHQVAAALKRGSEIAERAKELNGKSSIDVSSLDR